MPAEKLGQPLPIVQSMLLADHVHMDPATGKRYILGTYNGIRAATFPHAVPKLCLFVALTGAHGAMVLRLRIVDMDEEAPSLLESSYPVNMPNPNEIYYFPVTLSVVFPTPGTYRIQLFAGNDLLRELRLHVGSRQETAPSPSEL